MDTFVKIDLYRPRGCGGGNRVAWVLLAVSPKLATRISLTIFVSAASILTVPSSVGSFG